MNITDRNVGRDNKQIQDVSNDLNNSLSLSGNGPKQNRIIDKVSTQKIISLKKNVPYDDMYARKNNTTNSSSYSDDLINSFNLKTQAIKDDTHTLLTSTASSIRDKNNPNIIIEKVKPKNQVSGIVDKNLMSHLILPSSLVGLVVPKNNIKPMNVYRKPDNTPLPPIIQPVTTLKEKMITTL
tara:strand:- start:6578 stop:7123 length:546 start_codon:yes stop_codon:yes gene_type:complete